MNEIAQSADRIRNHAHRMFMQYGLKNVSMDELAKGLGISKKTIYLHYSDKDELVEKVVSNVIKENQANCEFDRSRAIDAVHEIFLAMDRMTEMFHSMNPSLLFDMQKNYPKAYHIFLSHKNNYIFGLIKENLIRGIKEGLYRDDINIEVLTRFRVESIILPFNPEFHNKSKHTLAAIENEITLHFLYGLVSSKGYKQITKYIEKREIKPIENANI
jgi:AcrR family transcriptional regulator